MVAGNLPYAQNGVLSAHPYACVSFCQTRIYGQ